MNEYEWICMEMIKKVMYNILILIKLFNLYLKHITKLGIQSLKVTSMY